MLNNVMLRTDSYKGSHWAQYPPGTTKVYSYLEARAGGEYKETVFFGLQYYLKKYLVGQVVTREKIEQAASFFAKHLGDSTLFNREGWEHILNVHGGCLPVVIKAVAEGTVVPESNVLLTIENTDPKCFWLVNYLETMLVQVWYGITTATISREMKRIIKAALKRSGTDTEENLLFKLHDFGYRGVSSPESAAIGAASHLVNFRGTDTIAGCELLMEYYNSDMPGFSIPAAEHSTITSWGESREVDAFLNMLQSYPKGPVAFPIDSWDAWLAISDLLGLKLRENILSRDGVTIARPDSGEPIKILPELFALTDKAFGFTVNKKGYKVFPQKVRFIQGDGISRNTVGPILDAVMDAGWSADVLAFGSGGGLLQDCNRDTQRFAMKCSYVEVDGVARDVYKRPATDPTKNSKRGRLMLVKDEHGYRTLPDGTPGYTDLLVPVFKDGELLVDHKLEDIRERAKL